MAGTTRRMSIPARPPTANAASVQAANTTPCRSKRAGKNGVISVRPKPWLLVAKYGW